MRVPIKQNTQTNDDDISWEIESALELEFRIPKTTCETLKKRPKQRITQGVRHSLSCSLHTLMDL